MMRQHGKENDFRVNLKSAPPVDAPTLQQLLYSHTDVLDRKVSLLKQRLNVQCCKTADVLLRERDKKVQTHSEQKSKDRKMSLFIGRQFKPSALNLSRPVLSELKDLDQNSN